MLSKALYTANITRGRRFDYTAYTPDEELSDVRTLSRISKIPAGSVPIYKSIEYLDRKGMQVLSTGSIEQWKEYMAETENTICGSKPLSVLLQTIAHITSKRSLQNGTSNGASSDVSRGKLQWIGYTQSSKASSISDSSVSYASGYAAL